MDPKTTTLFGGVKVHVLHEDGGTNEFTVRQLKLKEYQQAFLLIDDEIGLVALACAQTRQVIETVQPESYERLHAKMLEVNEKGFFTFAARQRERGERNLRSLPPEMLQSVLAGSSKRSISSMPSMVIPPPQG